MYHIKYIMLIFVFMKELTKKILFFIITISTLLTYIRAMFIFNEFNLTTIQHFSINSLLFGFLLYNSIYILRAYQSIFIHNPSYWTKNRKEIQKQPNGIYTLKEKTKLIIYFILYVIMLIILTTIIFSTKFFVTDIFTSIAIIFFIVDYIISFYKNI